MEINDLAAALRARAAGLCPVEAGGAPLISGTTPMAVIDWAATAALHAGELPCSGRERGILQLAASLAAGIPVDLHDTVTGSGDHNAARLLVAIGHAVGKRTENVG